MRPALPLAVAVLAAAALASPARAAPTAAAPTPAASTQQPVRLPQAHEHQRVIHRYLATLTEPDFAHGVKVDALEAPAEEPDPERQYRQYIAALLQQPHVGGKRGIGAVNCPELNFVLSTIESPRGVVVPPLWPEAMGAFITWDVPNNPWHDNKALKMRAFVTASVKMLMLEQHFDATAGALRADWNGYNIIAVAAAYPVFKSVLPAEVQRAYEEGLLRLGRRIAAVGPAGAECDYELSAALALWYVAHATSDPAFMEEARAYAQRLCTDSRFHHPAGYWPEGGGLDVGFGGMPNFWIGWLALASNWPFAAEALDRAYRLRSHLILPEPDGQKTGPSAFNTRLGSPAGEDQWDWSGAREAAAAMLSDEAVCQAQLPTSEQRAQGLTTRTAIVNSHLFGGMRNPPYVHPDGKRYDKQGRGRSLENGELRGTVWAWRIFPNGFNYPIEVNPGFDFYKPGSWARLERLQQADSPLLRSPYLRGENFVRNFGDAFVAAKLPGFAAVVHVGPVANPGPEEPMAFYKDGILGFGGGQLSAFWTPEAGSAILARRGGMQMRGSQTVNHDKIENWRGWPIHAISGRTAGGVVFSSGRIARPAVTIDTQADRANLRVAGSIPATIAGQEAALVGTFDYERSFAIDATGVRIETTVSSDGKEAVAELYETIPVFHHDAKLQPKAVPARIEFRVGDAWIEATPAWSEKVAAARVSRFDGAIVIEFESPRRVALADQDWKDGFLTRAVCRNILVDVLENGGQPATIAAPRKLAYRVAGLEAVRPE